MAKIIINKFSASWCGPCQVMKKTFRKVMKTEEFKDFEFRELDVDDDNVSDLIDKFGIRSVPTIVICDENNEQIGRINGNVQEDQIVQELNKYVG